MVEVLDYAQSCNLIWLPEPSRDGDDKSKYCAYHRNKGHDTEDCAGLKRVIENLLRSGELSQFAQKEKTNVHGGRSSESRIRLKKGKDPDHDEPPVAPSAKQTIHVIFGGPEGGDDAEKRQ